MENKYNLNYIKENGLILLEAIGGSHAYGTNVKTSDTDIRGVYIAEVDDFLCGNYPEQINDDKNDIVFYELSRFLYLIKTNNPNILELLNVPKDCIIFKHSLFDMILEHKDEFITKVCGKSFAGYGIAQIKKAKGLDKKQNWEKDKVTRKDVLDFVYVIEGEKSIPLKEWMADTELEVKFFGVVKIPNARDMYSLYYDWDAHKCFSNNISDEDKEKYKSILKELGKPFGLGYKGLARVGDE
jgi:uncharacterized protein